VEKYLGHIYEAPILGQGTGFSRTQTLGPHNQYLEQWANNGIFSLLAYVGMLAGAFWVFRRREFPKGMALILIVTAESVFTHNMFDRSIFLIVLALLLAVSTLHSRKSRATEGVARAPAG
jgi:O-antigen ligase